MSVCFLRLLVIVLGLTTLATFQLPDVPLPRSLTETPLSIDDQQSAQALASTLQTSEWLGPLAPIAISPFFGITCLCGITQFGGDYLPVNAFISNNPVLSNPVVFWVFLGLTLLTSLPRFTKVSKPAAQAIDQIEAYAGIITILVIRFLPGWLDSLGEQPSETAMVLQMGIFTVTADLLLAVAAIINIVVINSVKFFFEILVWLVPLPFIDAVLELSNKAFCAALMAIYAFSPLVATALNALMFLICLLMFRWINRQVGFLRAMIGDPVLAMVIPRYGRPEKPVLTVFPESNFGSFAAKSKLHLQPIESGWQLVQYRFLLPTLTMDLGREETRMVMKEGLFLNSIELSGVHSGRLLFSQRYRGKNSALAELIKIDHSNEVFDGDLKAELGRA